MTPVMQTRFTKDGDRGNCMTACVASLLDLPIESVPYFIGEPDFWDAVLDFLFKNGYEYNQTFYPMEGYDFDWKSSPGVDGYFICAGPSPRLPGLDHAVIYKNGVMVHDPHPDKTGILSIKEIDDIRRRV